MALKVFVDTDVVISSLISPQGAAFQLLHQSKNLDLFISNISSDEIYGVAQRLGIDIKKAKSLMDKRFSVIKLKGTTREINTTYADYVLDLNDAHIIAGAKTSGSKFIVSYNTKHFKADKLKSDFDIILTTPANLLQYLRSI